MSKDTKATIAILSFFVIFGLIVIIPLLISHNKKTEEVNKKNSEDNPYTSQMIVNAIEEALKKAETSE